MADEKEKNINVDKLIDEVALDIEKQDTEQMNVLDSKFKSLLEEKSKEIEALRVEFEQSKQSLESEKKQLQEEKTSITELNEKLLKKFDDVVNNINMKHSQPATLADNSDDNDDKPKEIDLYELSKEDQLVWFKQNEGTYF